MKIVILSTNFERAFFRSLGPYQLAYYLRTAGYEDVTVLDCLNSFNEKETLEVFDAYLKDADVVGLSTTFFYKSPIDKKSGRPMYIYEHYPYSVSVIDYLSKNNPNAKIVVGGANSFKPEYLKSADAIVTGYGERPFLDYIKWLDGKNPFFMPSEKIGDVIVMHSHDIIPSSFDHRFTDKDHIFENESLPIEISRGCIFKCSFCSFPANGKKKLDYLRSPQSVVDELVYNYEKFKTTHYFLCDDTFNDTTTKLKNLAELITKLPFKIHAVAYLRLDLLAAFPEQLELLEQIGVHSMFFGIESMHRPSRASIGKGADDNRLLNTLRTIKEKYPHWKTHGSFIVGLPHDTEKLILEGYETLKTEKLLTSLKYMPLAIRSADDKWSSDIEKHPEKFGYSFTEKTTSHMNHTWTSNTGLTRQDAERIAFDLDADAAEWSEMFPTAILAINSLSVNPEIFKSTKLSDVDRAEIARLAKERHEAYRIRLLSSK